MAKSVNLPRITLIAGLGGCVVIVMYLMLYWDRNPPGALLNGAVDPHQVDLYAEQAHGMKFDDTGKRVQTFTSPRVTHYVQSGETLMETPVLQVLTSKGEIWDGVARTGTLIGDTEIHLQGNVIISNKDNATQLHTEQLHYFPERREVTSDVAVLVNRDDDTLRGIGMRGDLDRNRIELLRKVEGNYVQP